MGLWLSLFSHICKYDLYVAVVVTFSTISWEHDVVRIQFPICRKMHPIYFRFIHISGSARFMQAIYKTKYRLYKILCKNVTMSYICISISWHRMFIKSWFLLCTYLISTMNVVYWTHQPGPTFEGNREVCTPSTRTHSLGNLEGNNIFSAPPPLFEILVILLALPGGIYIMLLQKYYIYSV